jgi:hypothetical protein
MQNNVTVINKQAFPLLYIVTLFSNFYHFIQNPVADFKCPQQQTALVGFLVCKCYANPSLRDGQLQGGGAILRNSWDVAAGDVAAGGSSGRSRQLVTLYCCSDYFTMILFLFLLWN